MNCLDLEKMDWGKLIVLLLEQNEIMAHVNFSKLNNPPLNFDVDEYASATAERLANLDVPFYKEETS